jgi:hemerythrin-like domain-containing protein
LGNADDELMNSTTIPLSGISPPGFNAPTAGFDQPFEMLAACHERVERTLRLLLKLVDHVEKKGCDEQARSAANDVLRYFDIAAPMHHDDEELHVFPLLLAQNDTALSARVRRMQADHVQMAKLWIALRALLLVVSDADDSQVKIAQLRQRAQAFCDVYALHIETEEQVMFPAAERLKSEDEIQRMGNDMRQRRMAS